MGWGRIRPTLKEPPDPPSLLGWLLAGLLTLLVGALLFILHASGTVQPVSAANIWWLSLSPVGVWLTLFCLRGWSWGKEIDEYRFQQHEKDYGQQQWEAWSERYLAVLGSGIFLPNAVNADNIVLPGSHLPSQYTFACRFPDNLPDEYTLIKRALASVQQTIKALPADLPLNVTLLTDLPARCDPQSLLSSAWDELFQGLRVPGEISTTDSISMAWVEMRLKQPVRTVDVILILQLYGADNYSDGMATLLLTSDDVADKYQLTYSARLLRPMPLDITCFKDDFRLFLDTQNTASRTARIFCDRQDWRDISAELLMVGAEKKADWLPDEIITFEKSIGIPGPAGQWLLAVLASEIAERRNTSILTLFANDTEHFVSSVIPGNKNG